MPGTSEISRWDELAIRFEEVLRGEKDSSSFAFVLDLGTQCKSFAQNTLKEVVPQFELLICNAEEYQSIIKSWEIAKEGKRDILFMEDYSASYFTAAYRGVAIDLERIFGLVQNVGIHNFLVNATLAIFDGLTHVTKPWLSHSDTNVLADYLTAEFLELPLADEDLKAVYAMTRKGARNILKLEKKIRSLYFRAWKYEDR
jgi:hypothetical protein